MKAVANTLFIKNLFGVITILLLLMMASVSHLFHSGASLFNLENWALYSFAPTKILIISWNMLGQLWKYLLIGIFISAFYNTFVPKAKSEMIFHRAGTYTAIIIASFIGMLSPLGSYAVLPIFASLLAMGLPLAPIMAFLTSSPIVNPFLVYATTAMLGWKMTAAILISAFFTGVITGLAFKWFSKYSTFKNQPGKYNDLINHICHDMSESEKYAALSKQLGAGAVKNKAKFFAVHCLKMTKYLGKWFVFSIILAAVIEVCIPPDWIVRSLGGSFFSLLMACAMAIPFYVCNGGAIPLVYNLLANGMDPGAALTFFIAGPVTRIAPMVTVIALVRYRVFGVYIGITLLCAVAAGWIYGIVM
jgi:uncharacterized membrane protein YraQ (UPF0718 family)